MRKMTPPNQDTTKCLNCGEAWHGDKPHDCPNQDTEVDGILDRAIIKGQDPKAHAIAVDEAKTALNLFYKSILLEVVGADLPFDSHDRRGEPTHSLKAHVINEEKAAQRQRLEGRLG